jgi:hypothetical protein
MREKILIVPSTTIYEDVAKLARFSEDLIALEELQLRGRQVLKDDEVELFEGSYLLAVKTEPTVVRVTFLKEVLRFFSSFGTYFVFTV